MEYGAFALPITFLAVLLFHQGGRIDRPSGEYRFNSLLIG